MATDTDESFRNKVIYEVYVRNHSEEGTFKELQNDLARIKSLGVDIIWLTPIQPVGMLKKKGSLGCPYSIRDYREINPEYGTLEDFRNLVLKIHQLEMEVIIDVVFNHTSHDSWLRNHHPEWFYHLADGEICTKIEDWTDVIDLDYSHPELWNYLIETLKIWVLEGVDGFRCDVASLIPIQFWQAARSELQKVKPGIFWLAESCDPSFIEFLRSRGFTGHSDGEIYQAFDITYDYDVYPLFKAYLQGQATLEEYLNLKRQQEIIYPANFLKLRFLENHDQARIRSMIFNEPILRQWTAFSFFEKGVTLLYAGQETLDTETPSLFNKEPIDWNSLSRDYCQFVNTMTIIKKEPMIRHGFYQIHETRQSGVIWASYRNHDQKLHGIFNVEGKCGLLEIDCPDGEYQNLVNGKILSVKNGLIDLQVEPVIFIANQVRLD